MSDRSDRRAELERKKARLAQMRAEKQKQLPQKDEERISVTVSSDLDQKRKETEDILRTVGINYSLNSSASATATQSAPPKTSLVERDGFSAGSPNRPRQPKAPKLGQSKITVTSVPPREVVSYTKETQTPASQTQQDSDDEFEELEQAAQLEHSNQKLKMEDNDDDEEGEEKQQRDQVIPELSEEEKHVIESSDDYMVFLKRSTRFVERALAHHVDLFTEYSSQVEEESEVDRSVKLTLNRIFSDERWSKRRMVTSLDWSSHHPELCVASYSNNDEAPYDPEGVALVWNSKYKTTTPEYRFHCQSSVTAACFAKFHPNFVIGGTYSGQVVLWDNRVNKRTTAQRSKLSTTAHTHPVYCIDVVGTQNAHNLISISNDGKMCSWSLDMLSQPLEALEMQHKQSKQVPVMCMSFPHNNVNNFAVGAEDGSVYTACRHGSKTGISDHYEGHTGPVSGIDFNRSTNQFDFSHLMLTSSLDWTIKLWSLKDSQRTFLHSFEDRSDSVYDVAWSPAHPALFASADCGGNVDLWNVNTDTEVPVVSAVLDQGQAANKLRWNSQGSQLGVGDSLGRVHLYEVGEQIATARGDEWSRFVRSLNEIRNMHQEEEEARIVARQL